MDSKIKTGISSAVVGTTILISTIFLPSVKINENSKKLSPLQYRNLKERLISEYEGKGFLLYDDKVMLVNILNYELKKNGNTIKINLKNHKKGESNVLRSLINKAK